MPFCTCFFIVTLIITLFRCRLFRLIRTSDHQAFGLANRLAQDFFLIAILLIFGMDQNYCPRE